MPVLDHFLIQAYIEKILAVKSCGDRILSALQPDSLTAPQGVWTLVKDIFAEEQTGTLSAKVQDFARQRLPATEIEKKANCSKSVQYAVSILGEDGLRTVIRDFTLMPIIGHEIELSYDIRSLKAYSEIARIVGAMIVSLAEEAARGTETKASEEINAYLENDYLLRRHWVEWKSSKTPEAIEKVCEVLFKAGQYHDIGMCVISGILENEGLILRVRKLLPNGFPNHGGLNSLDAERGRLNNHDHEKVGALYVEGIADSNSIFENAIYHHSRKGNNIISTITDLAQDLALDLRHSEILSNTIPSFENVLGAVSGNVMNSQVQASYDFMKTSINRAFHNHV